MSDHEFDSDADSDHDEDLDELRAKLEGLGKHAAGPIKKLQSKKSQNQVRKHAMRDAKARTIIRQTIDMSAFEDSTHSCETAKQLWGKLKPQHQLTEPEIQRMIASQLQIKHYPRKLDLVNKMHEVFNKAASAVGRNKARMHQVQIDNVVTNRLNLEDQKLRFFELFGKRWHTTNSVLV